MRTHLLAASALTVFALLAAPAAAHASGYVPDGLCASTSGTPAPGATVTVKFSDATFGPGQQVRFLTTGSGTVLLDGMDTSTTGHRKPASATGSAEVAVTLPTPASGVYTITGVDEASERFCAVALAVDSVATPSAAPGAGVTSPTPTADPAISNTSATGRSSASTLAETGYDAPFLVLWAAGGALVLGLVLMASIRIARRGGAPEAAQTPRTSGRHRA